MDGNPEFQRFFLKIEATQSRERPPNGYVLDAYRTERPPRIIVLRDINRIVDHIIAHRGTQYLAAADIGFLRDQISRDSSVRVTFVRKIRSQFTGTLIREIPEQWVSDQTDYSLLIPFLLVVLHRQLIDEINCRTRELLNKYKRVIALGVLGITPKQLRKEIRREKMNLEGLIKQLIIHSKSFELTYQFFVHRHITDLLDLKSLWQQRKVKCILFALPRPTPEQIRDFVRLNIIDIEIQTAKQLRDDLRNELLRLNRDRLGVHGPTRARLEQERIEIGEQIRYWIQKRLDLIVEAQGLRGRLRGMNNNIRLYLDAQSNHIYERSREAGGQRDDFLQACDLLISADTSLRLFRASQTEPEKWAVYQKLLEKLISGDANVSLEFLIAAYLSCYGRVNTNRDIGLPLGTGPSVSYGGGTYTGHGDNPIDLNAAAGTPVRLVAPRYFIIPSRFSGISGGYGVGITRRFELQRTVIAANDVHASSDGQQIIYKIATGLGFSIETLTETMDSDGETDSAPELLSHRNRRDFHPDQILVGLAFGHFTELDDTGGDIGEVNQQRKDILQTIEDFIKDRLGTEERIFRPIENRERRGYVGLGTLLENPGDRQAAVLQLVTDMLVNNSEGILDSLWGLLWTLRDRCGLPRYRAGGQSITVQHIYGYIVSGQPDLVVKVLYSHLSAIYLAGLSPRSEFSGEVVSKGATLIGRVGLTGRARSSHLHMHIQLCKGQNAFGAVFPHEFFALNLKK